MVRLCNKLSARQAGPDRVSSCSSMQPKAVKTPSSTSGAAKKNAKTCVPIRFFLISRAAVLTRLLCSGSFTIDCTKPSEDKIFDVAGFEKYLHDTLKVDGKAGQLGTSGVAIKRVGESPSPSFTFAFLVSLLPRALLPCQDTLKDYTVSCTTLTAGGLCGASRIRKDPV